MNKKTRQFFKFLSNNPCFHRIIVYWRALTASWHIYLEQPVSEEELTISREAGSIPSFGFFLLLICATVIATLGLLSNSTAVIIGAMIVAPLMNPILSMSFAIVTGNWTLYKRSWMTVSLGAICVIFFSYLISFLLPVNVVGAEILARTSPNLLDLGIAIAAGAAGAFSLTRRSIASSIAGVAIAVALVPPLCVTGIGLGIGKDIAGQVGRVIVGDFSISADSFLLFLVNFAAITFTASMIFLSQSYGSLRKAYNKLMIWFLVIALLCGPLSGSLQEFLVGNVIRSQIHQIKLSQPEYWQKIQIRYIDLQLEGNTAYLTILMNSPQGLLSDENLKDFEKNLFSAVSKMGVKAMDSDIRIIPVEIRKYQSITR
jgi:uncharacterized hydrophobic protein (TIGR00271 family)